MSESAAKSIRTKLGQIAETNAGVGNAALHVKIIGDFKVSYTVRDESDFNALPYLLAATPAVFDQTGNYRMGENIARLIMDDHAVLLNQGASDMKVTYKIDI